MGPYLVRNATRTGATLSINGDNINTTIIEVYAGDPSIKSISWNNRVLATNRTTYGSFVASIVGTENRTIVLPVLSDWLMADSLPERSQDYNDSSWVSCNKSSTMAPVAPLTLPVLYSSEYGYYTGVKIYRGYFNNTIAISANITA